MCAECARHDVARNTKRKLPRHSSSWLAKQAKQGGMNFHDPRGGTKRRCGVESPRSGTPLTKLRLIISPSECPPSAPPFPFARLLREISRPPIHPSVKGGRARKVVPCCNQGGAACAAAARTGRVVRSCPQALYCTIYQPHVMIRRTAMPTPMSMSMGVWVVPPNTTS